MQSASTKELSEDHEIIKKALNAIEKEVKRIRDTGTVDVVLLRDIVTFSQTFIDRCHHGKEEGCLFPCLEKCGISRDEGILQMILQEHETGRNLVKIIFQKLELYELGKDTAQTILEPCERYLELLSQHIEKENNVLFPMCEELMELTDDQNNLRCYNMKKEEIGQETIEAEIAKAENLQGK